ncbi:MAG: glucose-6-phosphate dehydrogenase [Pseudomonadota bacterium]|nr:glucose-6-phosphate dehydrogenase [Pseudomonadota bacterium]
MAFDLVFLGGTGDLAWRKLMPAVFQAFRHGALPPDGRVLASSREKLDRAGYCQWLRERFDSLSWDEPFSDEEFARFAELLDFRPLDISKPEAHAELAAWVGERNADTVVIYLAVAPALFSGICTGLGRVGLNDKRVRVVLEKPLGYDLASATAINEAVRAVLSEQQIFRIDHYLGKQSVQNLMALRFGNTLFEPLWRREWIQNVQITIAEDLGVEQRGGYYDRNAGALRDMVQNHMLQLLCMVAMEPPASEDADAVRDEKLKVLRSLKPLAVADVPNQVIRGQYRAGRIAGADVPGYREEEGVAPGSATETFVALRAEIENWRWAGVPFFLRTGKRLAQRTADIVVNFRAVPHPIFASPSGYQNRLVIRLQPEDSIELDLLAKTSNRSKSEQGRLSPVKLNLDFKEAFGSQTIEAYERLLRKVLGGRLDLFVRFDEQQAAWRYVEPILESWANDPDTLRTYNAGTWGPPASSALLARDGAAWPEER